MLGKVFRHYNPIMMGFPKRKLPSTYPFWFCEKSKLPKKLPITHSGNESVRMTKFLASVFHTVGWLVSSLVLFTCFWIVRWPLCIMFSHHWQCWKMNITLEWSKVATLQRIVQHYAKFFPKQLIVKSAVIIFFNISKCSAAAVIILLNFLQNAKMKSFELP